jgi:uncharacterized protein (DUF2252 family)
MFLSVAAIAACAPAPLYVSPYSYDFRSNPELLERIEASPHGYFRFINIPFSEEVCRRFADLIHDAPQVNLHGDAHLEQYAVTDLGRGLTDFDDTSVGPAVIDLVRFGVSLELTARAHGWQTRAGEFYERFLEGYRAALMNPTLQAPAPTFAAEIQKEFQTDRAKYFRWVESIVKPIDDRSKKQMTDAMQPYVEGIRFEHPELTQDYFAPVMVGRLAMGIGSALDQKFLIRIQGQTADPLDDILLEAKEVRDLSGITCIQSYKQGNAFRVLVGQARIAYAPYPYLGYVRLEGKTFWIHSWVDNYREFQTAKSMADPEGLMEVVYDVGVQLGLGHPNKIAAPLDGLFRRALLEMLAGERDLLRKTSVEMADETEAAWKKFTLAVKGGS